MSLSRRYKIFRKRPDKAVEWMEAAASLDDATIRLKKLAAVFLGEYFILDAENANCIIPERASSSFDASANLKSHSATMTTGPAAQTLVRNRVYVPPKVSRVRIPQ